MKPPIVKAISFIALLYIFLYGLFVYFSILEYQEMDFNKNGWVEFSEALKAINTSKRKTPNNCTEYYSLKDGLTILIDCD